MSQQETPVARMAAILTKALAANREGLPWKDLDDKVADRYASLAALLTLEVVREFPGLSHALEPSLSRDQAVEVCVALPLMVEGKTVVLSPEIVVQIYQCCLAQQRLQRPEERARRNGDGPTSQGTSSHRAARVERRTGRTERPMSNKEFDFEDGEDDGVAVAAPGGDGVLGAPGHPVWDIEYKLGDGGGCVEVRAESPAAAQALFLGQYPEDKRPLILSVDPG